MDAEGFDRIAKAVSRGADRRQLIAGLLGAALAGVSAPWVRAAECKQDGKTCKKNGQCCSGICVGGTDGGSTAHSEGVCGCPDGQVQCGGSCQVPCSSCPECQTCSAGCCVTDQAQVCAACGPHTGDPLTQLRCRNGECGAPGFCGG